MQDWRKEIAVMIYVKEAIAKLDVDHLWNYCLPRVSATEEQLRTAEAAVGHPLDDQYATFLRYANGWPSFYGSVDLFGTEELCGSDRMKYAKELLSVTAI